ncbi:gfo/Idh/MocA family oxidoreductase [Arenibacter sp. N53]|uniref:Gfo/Idh/MocA family protein n=1 Tax=Arenibacter TaxID=178469 RepID=UPI000CD3AF65|nr:MULTISPECIES: Gfo/Idh/MocA family oxidoreductase [Arenibacter]MCM4151407.1 gfo/Idh/MocA family oxidoreductase [Arenibacter sp. N53]
MKNHTSNNSPTPGRREFIKKSGIALIGSSLAYPSVSFGAANLYKDSPLKIGLIGCGGRGTGAAAQALEADPNVVLYAMGDVFEDRLEEAHAALVKIAGDKIKVEKHNKFIGFDAYLKVIESGVDVVLLTTPPAFRPDHLTAAVNAGKHVFCEKPVAVDAPGVHKVLAAAKKAKEKNLSLVSGFCFRYDYPNRAIYGRVLDGEIGDIRTVTTFRHGGEAWYKDRQPNWTDMTYNMRNWYYYNWLSGDFIVEQAVHSLDMMSWVMGDKMPVSATGTGGRQVRVDKKYGNIFDHFAVEFEYADGAKGYHFTRQQSDTSHKNSVEVFGSVGSAIVHIGRKYEITGKNKWTYEGERNNMFQTEHDELFASIRNGNPINNGEWMATSTMLAIWARMVGYTGQTISWEQAFNSQESLGPKVDEYHWDLKWPTPPIAVPGKTKFL